MGCFRRSNNRWLSFIDLIYFLSTIISKQIYIFNAQAFNQQVVVNHSLGRLSFGFFDFFLLNNREKNFFYVDKSINRKKYEIFVITKTWTIIVSRFFLFSGLMITGKKRGEFMDNLRACVGVRCMKFNLYKNISKYL